MTNWKDTVMSKHQLGNIEWLETPAGEYKADFRFIDDHSFEVNRIMEQQAEITGKIMYEEGKTAGIRATNKVRRFLRDSGMKKLAKEVKHD